MEVKKSGVIIRREEKGETLVLLLYYAKHDYWQFPKGHIDEGESAEETALREAKEETGYDVNIIKQILVEVKYKDANGNQADIVYFLAEIESGEMQAEEGYLLKWVPLDEADKILTYKELKDFIKLVAKDIKMI